MMDILNEIMEMYNTSVGTTVPTGDATGSFGVLHTKLTPTDEDEEDENADSLTRRVGTGGI